MIDPHELSLVGEWLSQDLRVVADETCHRIESLVASHLPKLANSPDGWSILFQDPTDNRLRELTYPQGHLHGGGPPALCCVSLDMARNTYGYVA